ncbi:MAG TPA: TerB family tellurite resistance protein [Candidatus Omnitrophota bacterium]|nr:TerB family tellurite resistance protein [Candidatus Omnitrophota bacterium]HPN55907.1 TerB family tellurite resistance protein [Candidatus Omnitrophota bacterium]
MSGFLDQFRKTIVQSVWKDTPDIPSRIELDDKIALGVLLWVVAEEDKTFLPEEESAIKEILETQGGVTPEVMPVVLGAIKLAARERIDLFTFTREVSQDLPYAAKKEIVENLFRVACADGDLAHEEQGVIRKIAGLCGVDHKDFIAAKLRIKKEFGLDTFGF